MMRSLGALLVAVVLCMSVGLATVVSTPSVAEAQNKDSFAYVDLQRALNEVEDGKKAKAKLKTMFNKRQKELDKKQDALKKLKDDLETKLKDPGHPWSDDKKREAMVGYQQQLQELQALYGKLQQELSKAEAKETQKIFGKMREILKGIGLKDGYTMILEKTESSILWAPKSIDITDALIQKYNSGK